MPLHGMSASAELRECHMSLMPHSTYYYYTNTARGGGDGD